MKKRITEIAIFSIALGAVSTMVFGQNVYKCGDGYSQQPCDGAKPVQAADPRSAAQKAQADAATQRAATSAQDLEKARRQRETLGATAYIPPAPTEPAENRKASTGKLSKPDVFVATSPAKPSEKTKSKIRKKRSQSKKA